MKRSCVRVGQFWSPWVSLGHVGRVYHHGLSYCPLYRSNFLVEVLFVLMASYDVVLDSAGSDKFKFVYYFIGKIVTVLLE